MASQCRDGAADRGRRSAQDAERQRGVCRAFEDEERADSAEERRRRGRQEHTRPRWEDHQARGHPWYHQARHRREQGTRQPPVPLLRGCQQSGKIVFFSQMLESKADIREKK